MFLAFLQDFIAYERVLMGLTVHSILTIDLFSYVVTWFEMGKQQFKMADA